MIEIGLGGGAGDGAAVGERSTINTTKSKKRKTLPVLFFPLTNIICIESSENE